GGTMFEQTDLAGSSSPSPDGGFFYGGTWGGGIGPVPGPLDGLRSPMRLASDGSRYVVAIEPTSVNEEIMVLFDLQIEKRMARRGRP
ncbi:MAG TPA: hypothetical protein VFQ07_12710, partial [Candidatus Polarisedimenticolia bacterium]|nr:hypothetical protein [Candidatus Polarisedimenticolia bacterium]